MTVQKEILYPVFFECCQYTEDTFWRNIFEDLAYGKTPYGTYINKNFLCCNYKDKEFSYKIIKKNPEQIYNDINKLLTKKLGILSHKEKLNKRVKFHQIETQIKDNRQDWSNIRKKNIKEFLIECYVVNMKKKHSLTFKQSKLLLSIITISIVFKVITSKHIHYSNGKIDHIEGIDFKNKKIHVKRNPHNINISFSPEISVDKKNIVVNWEKFLINMRKNKKK